MSGGAESGKAEVSHGMHYTEHRGTVVTLAFGQELAFVAGSEMRIVAGLESAFTLGAENKVGVATNTAIEWGAEVRWVRGLAVELAHEGGGCYENAFSVTAGATNPIAFKKLNTFIGFSFFPQVFAISAMLAVTKSTFVEGGKLKPEGATGAEITVSICQNIAGVMMALGTVILGLQLKHLNNQPLSVMTVNHASRAFLGVRSAVAAGNGTGSAGVAFEPNGFKLTASSDNRTFIHTGTEHEAVGFDSEGQTCLSGSATNLEIRSPEVQLMTAHAGADARSAFTMRSSVSNLSSSNASHASSIFVGQQLSTPPGKLQGSEMMATTITTGPKGFGERSYLTVAEKWARIQTSDGSMLELNGGKGVTLSFAGSSAAVNLTTESAVLQFGTKGAVKADAMGVELGGGALRVLSPNPPLLNAKALAQVKAFGMQLIAVQKKKDAAEALRQAKEKLKAEIRLVIAKTRRKVENRISVALAKTGAL